MLYLAVPHHLHEDLYIAAAQAGRDFLGEKPFGIDLALRAAHHDDRAHLGHARALLSLDDTAAMDSLATRIVAEGLSVRAVEEIVAVGEADGRDRIAMSLACHGAVRAGKTLSTEEMRDLVRQLEESEAPNRPLMTTV